MTPDPRPTTRRTVACAVALCAALGWAFSGTFRAMWLRWFPAWLKADASVYNRLIEGESYYTHGPVVALVSLFVAAMLLGRGESFAVRPRPVAGLLATAAALLVHVAATMARADAVSGLAFIGTLAGLVLTLWGVRALAHLWFPLAFLVFMIPMPETLLSNLNAALTARVAAVSTTAAAGVGVGIERTGNLVALGGNEYLVVENVCNGLRTMLSLGAFAALLSLVSRLRGAGRVWLFAMALPVAFAANLLRLVVLYAVAGIWGRTAAESFFHDTSGILIYVLAFLMMFGLERVMLWWLRRCGRPAPADQPLRPGPGVLDQLGPPLGGPAAWTAVVLVAATAVALHLVAGPAPSP